MLKFLILLLLISSNVYAKGGHKISRPVNSINTEDDAYPNKLVLNVESDSYNYQSTEYLAPMLTYSTNGWDLGISSQNVLLSSNVPQGSSNAQNFQNDTYINIAKTFKYGDVLKSISPEWSKKLSFMSTTFGTQNGLVVPLNTSVDPGKINNNTIHKFYYIDTDFEIVKNRFSVHGGPYYVNNALSVTSTYTGWLAGTEIVIIPKTLRFNADLYSGHSNISGSVFQATYTANQNFEIFGGWGRPASDSGNYNYFILGFNVIKIFN